MIEPVDTSLWTNEPPALLEIANKLNELIDVVNELGIIDEED